MPQHLPRSWNTFALGLGMPFADFTHTNNKAKAVRFSTLEALCKALDCQPADLLEYRPDET